MRAVRHSDNIPISVMAITNPINDDFELENLTPLEIVKSKKIK